MFGRDDALLDKRYSTASPQTGQHQDTSFGSVGSVAFAPAKPDFLADPDQLPSFAAPVAAASSPQAAPIPQPAPMPQPEASVAPVETPVFKTITKTQVADSPAIPESMSFSALFGSPAKPAAPAPLPASAPAQVSPQPQPSAAQPASISALPARQLEALGAVLEDFRGVDSQSFPPEAQLSFVVLKTLARQALNDDSSALKQLRSFGYEHFLAIARTLPAGHEIALGRVNQAAARLIGSDLMVPACTGWQASAPAL